MKKALQNAREGDVIGPLYRDGFLIILKVKEYVPEKTTRFQDVKEQIRNLLMSQEIEKEINRIFREKKGKLLIRKMF